MISENPLEGFRLSPQQRQVWLLEQAGSPLPFQALAAILAEGPLEPRRLEACLEKLVGRHEILRTRFLRRPGSRIPLQVIPEAGSSIAVGFQREPASAESAFRASFERPFDLESGELLRASVWPLEMDRHLLLLGTHSLCGDSRSLDLLVRELTLLYAGDVDGLPEVAQYADLAEGQNDITGSDEEVAELGRAYWSQRNLRLPPSLVLPFEPESKAPGTGTPDFHARDLGPEALARVEAAAAALEVSPAALLLSVWGVLLWRMTGQAETAIAVSVAGRNFEELRDAVGLFARSLPIRCRFEGHSAFEELARETDRALREGEDWQDYVSWPDADRRETTALKSPMGFAWEEWVSTEPAGGLKLSVQRKYTAIDPSRLQLCCFRQGESLRAECRYDGSSFRRPDVERLIGHFTVLLESALAETGTPLGRLPLLSDADRARLVIAINQTKTEYPSGRIHELFETQVSQTPEERAVVFEEQNFTYRKLNERANQIAHRLRRAGVGPNVRVGLCTERSAASLAGILGILKAGGAFVPLNPEHPPRRLSQQLEDSGSRYLVSQRTVLDRLPEFSGETFCLDGSPEDFAGESVLDPDRTGDAEDFCYVIYTSGSTGAPKGVAVRHRNLVNYVSSILALLRSKEAVGPGLAFALASTISADLGYTSLFPALVSGGCVHVLSADVAADGRLFGRYFARHVIDVLKIAPSQLESLLDSSEGLSCLPRKVLILGGERFSWELRDRLAALEGRCQVVNHYGPTETTVGSLTYSASPQAVEARSSRTVPIGRPIANTRVYLLDSLQQPVPVGVTGEIYLGGAGVAAGYMNRPEETRARFVPDPVGGGEDHLYRTGDLARFLPDGNLEYLGRSDHQVKVRGFRVELEEIEATLRAHPSVNQSVVVPGPDGSGGGALTAYVVAARESSISLQDLRLFAREVLPDYMVPGRFVFLRALPRTASGKVDRQAVASSEPLGAELRADAVAPRTPTEQRVAAVWSDVLKQEGVGVHDDFFDLGGHSLLVTQVVARLRREFLVELPLRSVFESPTVASLSDRIDQARRAVQAGLLQRVEALSEDEAEALLAAESRRPEEHGRGAGKGS